MLRAFRIYHALVSAALRAEFQYRGNFISATIGGLLFQGAGIAFVAVVAQRFGSIGGWSLGEVALLYGMRLTSHGLWTIPFAPVISIDSFVREGGFDRVLVRPVNAFVQVATTRFILQTVGDLLGGIVLLAVAATMVDIDWSGWAIGYLLLALVGGAMVEFAVQLLVTSLAFRMTTVRSIRTMVDNIFNTFGGYPLKIFPAGARFALTFMLPAAFMAYFPATVLLQRTDELSVQPWVAYGAPAAGVLLVWLSYTVWRRQLRHYESTGH